MQRIDLGANLTLMHYSIFEDEDSFMGNIPFWTQMMRQSILMPRGQRLKNAWLDFKISFH